jgi:hypothetical protein
VTVAVGGAKALLLEEEPEFPVVPAPLGPVVVVAPVAAVVGVDAGGAGGGLTLNWVPVTTVTCDPGDTWLGSSAMITEPDMELATACAAASSAGVLDE